MAVEVADVVLVSCVAVVWVPLDPLSCPLPELSNKTPLVVAARAAREAGVGCVESSTSTSRPISRERRLLPLLESTSLKAMSAFSVLQEISFMLNSAIIVTGSRVISKSVLDWSKMDGRELPIVAFLLMLPLSMSELTQLLSALVVHCEPVYPFEQTQEHFSPLETLTPPFSQVSAYQKKEEAYPKKKKHPANTNATVLSFHGLV